MDSPGLVLIRKSLAGRGGLVWGRGGDPPLPRPIFKGIGDETVNPISVNPGWGVGTVPALGWVRAGLRPPVSPPLWARGTSESSLLPTPLSSSPCPLEFGGCHHPGVDGTELCCGFPGRQGSSGMGAGAIGPGSPVGWDVVGAWAASTPSPEPAPARSHRPCRRLCLAKASPALTPRP